MENDVTGNEEKRRISLKEHLKDILNKQEDNIKRDFNETCSRISISQI
jgi:hypothetical protein